MYRTSGLPNTRIDVADALRGIAVAGIILYHSVEHFDIFTQDPIVHTLACDQTVGDVLAWLLSGKMYGIFAMHHIFCGELARENNGCNTIFLFDQHDYC